MEEKKVISELKEKFTDRIKETTSDFGDDTVTIDRDFLAELVQFLKQKPYEYTMLLDITCVDYLGREPRFEMVYHLLSLSAKHRLRIKVPLAEKNLSIESMSSIWKNANWLEREVYDMFGVRFYGHPDLRRLFMYDGFEGFPLRKDYPLRKCQPRIKLRK
ncbi:MAG: NADH-quinone oxidoreductase subunit C [Candidatus Aminicenantes bacterium]|nr:NADH-quinone oxidoreductase subunit C [Candidatus Aminicenantes bacterium]